MRKINMLNYSSILWFLIRASFIEVTLTALINSVKQDSWICVIAASILGIIPLIIYENLKNNFPNDNIITLNKKTIFGKGLNTILIIASLALLIPSFWLLIHFTSSIFLYKTSLWVVGLAFIIPIGYAASKNINIIGKVSLMLFYVAMIFLMLIILGLFTQVDITNIKPFLERKENLLYGTILIISTNIIKIFFLNIIPKNEINNYSTKKTILIYIITCLSLINITFMTIGVFGIDLASLYEYPGYQILERVNVLNVFDKLERILWIEWLFSLFIEIIIIIFFIKESIILNFNIKKTNKFITPLICFITYIISNLIFITQGTGEKFFTTLSIPISLISFLIIPTITLFKNMNNSKMIK